MKYRRLDREAVARLIAAEARHAPDARRVFLADGDVMRRPAAELIELLEELARHFPDLARVNAYATGRAIASKNDAELRRLRELKLCTLYLGLESGDDDLLRRVCKGEESATMIEAAQRAQAAGLRLSVMVLLGLGGREGSDRHADATAAALNAMQPRLLSALRVIPVPGTELHDDVKAGRFCEVSERGAVAELRRLVAGLDLHNTVFRANHSSNVVPLEARFPRDKPALLQVLDRLLASGRLDARSPGTRPLWL